MSDLSTVVAATLDQDEAAVIDAIRRERMKQKIERSIREVAVVLHERSVVPRRSMTASLNGVAGGIIEAVAKLHGVTRGDILGDGRVRPIQMARNHAYWLLHEVCEYSYPQIGVLMGRNHSSVLGGARQHAADVAKHQAARAAAAAVDIPAERV